MFIHTLLLVVAMTAKAVYGMPRPAAKKEYEGPPKNESEYFALQLHGDRINTWVPVLDGPSMFHGLYLTPVLDEFEPDAEKYHFYKLVTFVKKDKYTKIDSNFYWGNQTRLCYRKKNIELPKGAELCLAIETAAKTEWSELWADSDTRWNLRLVYDPELRSKSDLPHRYIDRWETEALKLEGKNLGKSEGWIRPQGQGHYTMCWNDLGDANKAYNGFNLYDNGWFYLMWSTKSCVSTSINIVNGTLVDTTDLVVE